MVEIRVKKDNNWITLTPPEGGFKISYELENPILNLDSIDRVNSMSFTVPFSPVNDKIFNHKRLLEVRDASSINIEAMLIWQGVRLKNGLLIFDQGIGTKGYEAYFVSSGRLFYEYIKEKNLADFDYDGPITEALYPAATADADIPLEVETTLNATLTNTALNSNYCFPMLQVVNFYNMDRTVDSAANPEWANTDSSYDGGGVKYEYEYINSYIGRTSGTAPLEGYNTGYNEDNSLVNPNLIPTPIVPMPFVSKVLQHIFEVSGLTFQGVFLTDYDLIRLIFFNVTALELSSKPTTYAEHFKNTINIADHLPEDTSVKSLITSLQKAFFCITIIDDIRATAEMVFINDIFAEKDFLDITKYCMPLPSSEFVKSGPNISFEYTYNSENEYAEPTDAPPYTETANQVTNDPDFQLLANQGVQFYYKPIGLYNIISSDFSETSLDSNKHTVENYKTYPTQAADEEIVVDFDTLAPSADRNYIIHSANMPGKTPRFKGSEGTNPFTLLFYPTFKVVSRREDHQYNSSKWLDAIPTAMAHDKHMKNAIPYLNRSLYWKCKTGQGNNCLIDKQGAEYIAYLESAPRPVTYKAYIDVNLLRRLAKWKEPFYMIDGNQYIIEKVSARLTASPKALATLYLKKL